MSIRETFIIGRECHERFLPLQGPAARVLRDYGVVLAGLSDLRGEYRIGRPDYADHVIVWTLAGRGRFTFADESVEVRSGERMLVPARTPYACTLLGRGWRIAWLHLEATRETAYVAADGPRVTPAGDSGPAIAEAMAGILREADEPLARLYAELGVGLIARDLQPGLRPSEIEARDRLRAVWDQVERDLAYPWTVESLATLAHLSAVQVHRLCVQHLGRSPIAHLTHLRMQRAAALLRSTTRPLKQIAPLVGYQNPFAFSTAFKRHTGRSPRDWRDGS